MRLRNVKVISILVVILVLILASCSGGSEEQADAGTQSGAAAQTGEAGSDEDADATMDSDSDEAPSETGDQTEDEGGEPEPPEFQTAEAIGMTLAWRVIGAELEVEVTGPTTGWIAVGFKPSRAMQDADIFIGYVNGSEAVMTDQFGISMTDHREDERLGGSVHVSDVTGTEENGTTTIRFRTPLETGDEYDQPLEAGETLPVILAYGPDGADDVRTYHEDRAGVEITL